MKRLITLLCLIPSVAFAAPVKIPNLNVCVQPGGTIVVKQRCAKTETMARLQTIATSGAQGPQGIPGTIDISKCVHREQTASGAGSVSTNVSCLVSEFIVSNGCHVSTGTAALYGQRLAVGSNSQLGPQAYGVLQCAAFDPYNSGQSYTLVAQALCCTP